MPISSPAPALFLGIGESSLHLRRAFRERRGLISDHDAFLLRNKLKAPSNIMINIAIRSHPPFAASNRIVSAFLGTTTRTMDQDLRPMKKELRRFMRQKLSQISQEAIAAQCSSLSWLYGDFH